MLPNFLVIGAPRSGTTWIDRNLRDHPDVQMSSIKETHFFDRHYDRGIEHYETYFRGWKGQRAVGEATPAYLHGQFSKNDIPRLIHRHLPRARLIACLRNPVERIYSEYCNGMAQDPRNRGVSFEQKLERRPEFFREGLYFQLLQPYLRLFPRENLLILLYDDLVADPRGFLRTIHQFLGVEPEFRSDFEGVKVNQAGGKGCLAKSRSLWFATRALSRLRMHRSAERLRRFNTVPMPEMNPETRRVLVERYRPHNEQLAQLTGRDLSHWNAVEADAPASTPRAVLVGERRESAVC